jgi:GT2 family glycosyltransferase
LTSFDPSRPLVIAAGRLSPEKGTINLLLAAKNLQRGHSRIQFAIFGDGTRRKYLQQQSRSLGLEDMVHFVGYRADFTDLVAGADLLVNPSLTEQLPNVVLEAMSAGVPIVATAVGGVPELARDGAIALVAPGDANALARAIADLISSPSKCRAMVEKSRERLQHDFSPEKQAEQLKSLYGEFITVDCKKVAPTLARISVVIPVRNEEQRIGAVLEALRKQDYPSELFEVVVTDGMSTDRTTEVVAQYVSQPGAPIHLVRNLGKLSSSGRNLGVATGSGEVIVFVDGHCHIPSRDLLKNVTRLFESTGADILCRPQPLDCPGNNYSQRVIAAARASWLGHGVDSTIYSTTLAGWVDPSSAGAIYRRSLFDRFEGFDERFDACEDVEFNYRLHQAGIKAYISPDLTIFYEPRNTLSSLFNQMMRYGKGRVRLARKHPRSFSWPVLVPAGVVLLLLLGVGAAFTKFLWVWLLMVGIYAGIVVVESTCVARRIGLASFPRISLAFIAIHAGLGAGLILEWVKGQTHVAPQAANVQVQERL